MSHLATIKTEIKDLEAVKALCAELGLTFHEGKTTFGMMKEMKNEHGAIVGWDPISLECSHTISHAAWQFGPKIPLEVGLVKTETGYSMQFDEMLQTGRYLSGRAPVIGQGASRLVQLYGVHKSCQLAHRLGYQVQRTQQKDGSIRLAVSGM